MKSYPSILGARKSLGGEGDGYGFYKYDGSNMRAEWNPKRGWYKFGSRTQLVDRSSPVLGKSVDLFHAIGDDVIDRLKQELGTKFKKYQTITAFGELFGPSSFAGVHSSDEEHELKLFDIFLFQDGFLPPKRFVDAFGSQSYAAELVFPPSRHWRDEIEGIRNSQFLDEGVIFKGEDWMVKVKTNAYLKRLKDKFGAEWINHGGDE